MPLYDYECHTCGMTREVLHGMNETPVVVCDQDHPAMVRQIGSGGFRLRGDGWYATDFASTPQRNLFKK